MEITPLGIEETKTVHFDTRLSFEIDQDGKVLGGSKELTEQELFDMLARSNEPDEVETETVIGEFPDSIPTV